ncbi:MAG TPA: toll/interleukin-1 receptor domain-containing protein [Acetobacteraceae bacterium]
MFISHASTDRWVAEQLAVQIRKAGADTFLDAVDIDHGDDFEERINAAEARCAELLVLLTPWAMERPWVWIEVTYFRHSRKLIVGVLHGVSPEDIASHPQAAILLRRLDLVDINQVNSYLVQLKRRVNAAASRGSHA